ncbi:MAG: hypothetical protein M1827_001746 [Pycnora praestabilis]|nr:MAG: hypothetical protein M1827_001746 [Pycnora praestabilis]
MAPQTDENREVFPGIAFSTFKTQFINPLITEASELLCNGLLFTSTAILDKISLTNLHDDIKNTISDYSFISSPQNAQTLKDNLPDISSNLKQNPELAKQLLTEEGTKWKPAALMAYINKTDTFLEQLLLLLLLTGGQPDQSPAPADTDSIRTRPQTGELVNIIHTNTPSAPRNIYAHKEGGLMIITASASTPSSPAASSAQHARVRFLPIPVSKLLLLYLTCVRPFISTLMPSGPYACSRYLFVGPKEGVWRWATYEGIVRRESKGRLGREVGVEDVNKWLREVGGGGEGMLGSGTGMVEGGEAMML